MIIIEQALYGEKPGMTSGHDLLAASGRKNEIFKRVSGGTDLADRPVGGVLKKPVVRGFFLEGHFLLIKTFPDSQEFRSGRVFAHVLFIKKDDLSKVENLLDLFSLHLKTINKEASMASIEYEPTRIENHTSLLTAREAEATNTLLDQESVVWLSENGYWEWLNRIWPRIPIETKTNLRIGPAFSPQRLKSEVVNIVFIPSDSSALWARHSIKVIDFNETVINPSEAAIWLIGDATRVSEFESLINDFNPQVNSLSLIKRLQDNGRVYHKLDQNPELGPMLTLAHFISRVSPGEASGQEGKKRLFSAILKSVPNAKVQQIKALFYQTWKGFPSATDQMTNVLNTWLTKNQLSLNLSSETGSILVQALNTDSANWWTTVVLDFINEHFQQWRKKYASIIWNWIVEEPILAREHSHWLPDSIETDIVDVKPRLKKTIAESVIKMAKEKGWLLLHAQTVSQLFKPVEAIEQQLLIDTDPNHSSALLILSKNIEARKFIYVAANSTDSRLHELAGRLIVKNSKLLKDLDIAKAGWQNCWEQTIEKGGEIWNGIQKPKSVLFKICDHLLTGNTFNSVLLEKISNSSYNNLKEYPQRVSIWEIMPENVRTGFLTATITDLIPDLINNQLQYGDLEPELQHGLKLDSVLNKIISSKIIDLGDKIRLSQKLPYWTELLSLQMAKSNQFNANDAKIFGQLVLRKNWKSVAYYLYSERFRRKDLVIALTNCLSLLGWWERINCYNLSGTAIDKNTKDEWWATFLTSVTMLYPEGPNQNGLWERAGGDRSQLYITGTAKTIWNDALRQLRNHGNVNARVLLELMLEEYPNNETLLRLRETL